MRKKNVTNDQELSEEALLSHNDVLGEPIMSSCDIVRQAETERKID